MTASDILTVILPSVFGINLPSSSLVKALHSPFKSPYPAILLYWSIILKASPCSEETGGSFVLYKRIFININALTQKALQFNFTA